jgi:hypothetical protein
MRNSKNKPFNIPNGFFEKQRTEILDATSEKHHIHKGHVIKRKLVVRSLAMAASLTAIGILSIVWINKSTDKCASFICLLESTDFNNLSESDYNTLDIWEENLIDEEFELLEL